VEEHVTFTVQRRGRAAGAPGVGKTAGEGAQGRVARGRAGLDPRRGGLPRERRRARIHAEEERRRALMHAGEERRQGGAPPAATLAARAGKRTNLVPRRCRVLFGKRTNRYLHNQWQWVIFSNLVCPQRSKSSPQPAVENELAKAGCCGKINGRLDPFGSASAFPQQKQVGEVQPNAPSVFLAEQTIFLHILYPYAFTLNLICRVAVGKIVSSRFENEIPLLNVKIHQL
jgi:hypothetical protein